MDMVELAVKIVVTFTLFIGACVCMSGIGLLAMMLWRGR